MTNSAEKELQELRLWKESAMAVMPDYQRIAKLIGVPLGQSVHDKLIPFLEKVVAGEGLSNVKDEGEQETLWIEAAAIIQGHYGFSLETEKLKVLQSRYILTKLG